MIASTPIVSSFDTKIAHPNIASLAAKLYNESEKNKLTNEEIQWIVTGAEEEDMPTRWFNHFYDPVHDQGMWFGQQFLSARAWSSNSYEQTNFSLGDQSWKRALYNFQKGKRKEAFIALGHTLHLIADMAVPAHTRLDPHPTGDSLEQYVKGNWSTIEKQIEGKAKMKKVYNLPAVFDVLAGFSNGYFYSDDSAFDKKYNNPNFYDLLSREETINGKSYKFLFNNNFLKNKLCRDKSIGGWQNNFSNISSYDRCIIDDSFVLSSYSTLLLPQAIGYSAGVIKLFFTEASGKTINANELSSLQKSGQGFTNEILGSAVSWGIDAIDSAKGEGVDSLNSGSAVQTPSPVPVLTPTKITAPAKQTPIPASSPKPIISSPPSNPVLPTVSPVSPPLVLPSSPSYSYSSGGGGGSSNTQPPLAPATVPVQTNTTTSTPIPPITTPEEITPTTTQNSSPTPTPDIIPTSTPETPTVIPTSTPVIDIPTPTMEVILVTSTSIPDPSPEIIPTTTLEITSTTPDIIPTSTPEIVTTTLNINSPPTSTPDIVSTTTQDIAPTSTPTPEIIINTSTPETPTSTLITTSTPTTPDIFLGPGTGEVVINEIAWAGTTAERASEEWIELYNNTDTDITLASNNPHPRWKLMVGNLEAEPDKIANAIIPAHGYYLMERGSEDTIINIPANTTYALAYGLKNSGAKIQLLKPDGTLSDEVDCSTGWFAGDNTEYRTMERLDTTKSGNDPTNWQTNKGPRVDPRNHSGGQIFGSPKASNFGNISLNTTQLAGTVVTLTAEDGPYVLGGYNIKQGAVLNIDPGVVIKSNFVGAAIIVEGALNIRGTAEEPVHFTSGRDLFDGVAIDEKLPDGEPAMGDWQGLWFWPGSVGNIENLDMRFAGHKYVPGKGMYTPHKSEGIRSDSASVTINNSKFLHDGEVFVRSIDNSNLSISNSIFDDGNVAIFHTGFATPILTNNEYIGFTDPMPVQVLVVQ